MKLFQFGTFRLHSGAFSRLKIECDTLTDSELDVLAYELAERLPLFSAVEGVPTGGLQLASAMRPYATGYASHPLLIVDDVYTTGTSMEEFRAGRSAIGAVLFARNPVSHDWITALFTMPPLFDPERRSIPRE